MKREDNRMRMKLDELRRERDWTWDVLSERTGISKPTLLKLSAGESKLIRLEHLDALCVVFGIDTFDKLMEPTIVRVPLQKDPKYQERGKKGAAGRWGDDG